MADDLVNHGCVRTSHVNTPEDSSLDLFRRASTFADLMLPCAMCQASELPEDKSSFTWDLTHESLHLAVAL